MSEIKPIQVLTSVTGPGYVDLMEYFSPVDDADDGAADRIIFVGYDAKTIGVDGIFHVVCAIPERERHYAELIVTAVNAHADLCRVAQAAVHALRSYYHGNSSHELAEEIIPHIEAALKLARGES